MFDHNRTFQSDTVHHFPHNDPATPSPVTPDPVTPDPTMPSPVAPDPSPVPLQPVPAPNKIPKYPEHCADEIVAVDHIELVSDYDQNNKAAPNNNLFFEKRSNPLSSKGN